MTRDAKTRLWLVAFAVSIMANMFFIGVLTSPFAMHRLPMMPHGPMGGPPSPFLRMQDLAKNLSDTDRATVDAIVAEHQAAGDRHMQDIRKAFDRMNAALAAPNLDTGAIKAAQKDMTAADQALKKEMDAAFLELASRLPENVREDFFTRMLPPMPQAPDNAH